MISAITILTKVASKAVTAVAYSIIGADIVKANFNSKDNAIRTAKKIATTALAVTSISIDTVKDTTIQVATDVKDAVSQRKAEILAKHK